MDVKETSRSPRLEQLRKELEAGKTESLVRFWEDVKELGTPLVEEIEGDSEHRLVTFLWQGSSELVSVALVSLMTKPGNFLMTHMPGTDIWYVTLRLPSDLRSTYQFFPNDLLVLPDKDAGSSENYYLPDPYNPNTFAFYDEKEDPTGVKLTRSVLELPHAPAQPWIKPQKGVPQGKVHLHQLPSRFLQNERRVWVYSPANYTSGLGKPLPLVVLFDGWAYAKLMPTFTILDNLIAAQIIPPTVLVLPESLDSDTRMKELVFYEPFNQFLVFELIPWIFMQYSVTTDPKKTVVGGAGAGGLAAAYAALENPNIFGNVLSQSGMFTMEPKWHTESGWLARQFSERHKMPLKFHLDVGTLEESGSSKGKSGENTLTENRHLRDVLRARGYDVHYTEFSGGDDYISWQGTLAEGLVALLG